MHAILYKYESFSSNINERLFHILKLEKNYFAVII